MYKEYLRVQILQVLFRKKSQPWLLLCPDFCLPVKGKVGLGALSGSLPALPPEFFFGKVGGRGTGSTSALYFTPQLPCTQNTQPRLWFELQPSSENMVQGREHQGQRGGQNPHSLSALAMTSPKPYSQSRSHSRPDSNCPVIPPHQFLSTQLPPVLLFNSYASDMPVTVLGSLSAKRGP